MMQKDVCALAARALGAYKVWAIRLHTDEPLANVVQLPEDALAVAPLHGMPVRCLDLRAMAEHAKSAGTVLVADLTLPGVRACAANRLGAHVSFVRLDKELYVIGISSEFAHVAHETVCLLNKLEEQSDVTALMVQQRIDEIDQSWRTTSDAAQVVASFVRCHPKVKDVRYPGLKTDPSFAVAARTLSCGFGPIVDYRLKGSDNWRRICCTSEDVHDQVLQFEHALREETVD